MTPEDAGAYFCNHRSEIEAGAMVGDRHCLAILALRKMLYACPNDPGALGLLCGAITEYAKTEAGAPAREGDHE